MATLGPFFSSPSSKILLQKKILGTEAIPDLYQFYTSLNTRYTYIYTYLEWVFGAHEAGQGELAPTLGPFTFLSEASLVAISWV